MNLPIDAGSSGRAGMLPPLSGDVLAGLAQATEHRVEFLFGDGQQDLQHELGQLATFPDAMDRHPERLQMVVAAQALQQAPPQRSSAETTTTIGPPSARKDAASCSSRW